MKLKDIVYEEKIAAFDRANDDDGARFHQRRDKDCEFAETLKTKIALQEEVMDIYRATIRTVEDEEGIDGIFRKWAKDPDCVDPTKYKQEVLVNLREHLADLTQLHRAMQKCESVGHHIRHLSADDIYALHYINQRHEERYLDMGDGVPIQVSARSELEHFARALYLDAIDFETKPHSEEPVLGEVNIAGRSPLGIAAILNSYSALTLDSEQIGHSHAAALKCQKLQAEQKVAKEEVRREQSLKPEWRAR